MKLIEYCWKASHQIILSTTYPLENCIEGWGSGFILKYNDQYFFITCDHNLHMMDDYGNGKRTGSYFDVEVICNCCAPQNNSLSTGLIKIRGFYYYNKISIQFPELSDLIDVAIAPINLPLPQDILTNLLCDYNGNVLVNAGEKKLCIDAKTSAKASKSEKYVITGCIRNRISGIKMDRNTTVRENICYADKMHSDFYVFKNPILIVYDDWKGLSGSPVFSEHGKIVGMLNEVVDGSYELYVVPICDIIKCIEYSLQTRLCL